jgi:sulfate adenylyltransferase
MGADDMAHPSVAYLHKKTKEFYVGGKVQAIQAPTHYDYVALRCRFTLPALEFPC